MSTLIALIIPIIILCVAAMIVLALVEKFSPDATVTYIVRIAVFAVVLIVLIQKLLPLLHL